MPNAAKLAKKQAYFDKLINLCETSPSALIVGADNVGSRQLQNIRIALRGKCTVLMGKNTQIRTALRKRIEEKEGDAGLEALLENIEGNMGFIFCQAGQMERAREVLGEFVKPAAAKAGVISPVDHVIPAGPTGLEPSQTNFFQALNITTKIVKGAIELTADYQLLKVGEKVTLSAVALLNKLGMKPFSYGMKVLKVYQDGAVFDAAVLDINDSILMGKFMNGVANVAAFSREIGIPTEASLPHMMTNAFKNVASLVCELDYTFPEVEIVKEFIADPSKFAFSSGGGGGCGGGGAAAPAAAAAAVVEEEEEEEEMEFDLFD